MKTRLFTITALLCLVGTLFSVSVQAQEVNKIDAFTSSSKRLKVDSIIVFKNQAFIYWNEFWKDEMEVLAYRIKWKTATDATYQDSVNLRPYVNKVEMVDTIQPLNENTKYTGQIYRNWNGRLFIVDFPFNTPPLPNRIISYAPRIKLTGSVTGYEVFTIDGKQILSTNLSGRSSAAASVYNFIKNPGLYIINVKGVNGRVLQSEKILIGG